MSKTEGYYNPDEQNATMDLSGVSEGLGFDPIPKGTYAVEVDECEYKMSSNDNPMLVFVLKVIDNEEYGDRKLWENLVLNNDFGIKKLKTLLARWFPTLDLSTFNPQGFAESGEAIGVTGSVKLTVKKDKSSGEMRNQITDFLTYDEAATDMQNGW